jgi:hypothetical protein
MQDVTRRQFIAKSAVAGAAASLPVSAVNAKTQASRGDMSFIHLFLPGGWPCNDLWDPKPYSPFRAGMRGSELTSTVGAIETNVPGMMLGSVFGNLAGYMGLGVVVRSLVDPSNTLDHAESQRRMLHALTFDRQVHEIKPYDAAFSPALSRAIHNTPGSSHMRIVEGFIPYHGFDSHESGARRIWASRFLADAIAGGVGELFDAGRLDRTILCISSEFNRTIAGRPAPGSDLNTGENLIIKDERDYGFHAHFAEANSIVLFGGPFKRGFVYGKTGPKHPMRVVENPVTLADIHATIATALGVPPREGRVIEDLFA